MGVLPLGGGRLEGLFLTARYTWRQAGEPIWELGAEYPMPGGIQLGVRYLSEGAVRMVMGELDFFF